MPTSSARCCRPPQCFAIPDRGLTADQIGPDAATAALPPLARPAAPAGDIRRPGSRAAHFAIPDVVGPVGATRSSGTAASKPRSARPMPAWTAGCDAGAGPAPGGSAAYAGRAFAGRSFFGRPAGGGRIVFDLLGPAVVPVHVAAPLNRAVAVAGRGSAGHNLRAAGRGRGGRLHRLTSMTRPAFRPRARRPRPRPSRVRPGSACRPNHVLLKASVPGDRALPPRWRFAGQGFALPERNRSLRFRPAGRQRRPPAGERVLIELNPHSQGRPDQPAAEPRPGDRLMAALNLEAIVQIADLQQITHARRLNAGEQLARRHHRQRGGELPGPDSLVYAGMGVALDPLASTVRCIVAPGLLYDGASAARATRCAMPSRSIWARPSARSRPTRPPRWQSWRQARDPGRHGDPHRPRRLEGSRRTRRTSGRPRRLR